MCVTCWNVSSSKMISLPHHAAAHGPRAHKAHPSDHGLGSTGRITRCALRCIRRRRRRRCSRRIAGRSARLLASLRTRLLLSLLAGLVTLPISASRQHRLTVLPHRRPRFQLGPRQCQRSFKIPPPAVIENSPTPG